MALPKMQPMSEAEYEVWHREQEDRYEYVDGRPQLKFAEWDGPILMTGATQAHNLVAFNVQFLMRSLLQGGPCRSFQSNGKVLTPRGNHRFPDVVVDCGKYRPTDYELEAPTVIFEVLSKSTHWIDTTRKLEDYKSIATVQHIVFLAQDEMRGQCWSRGAEWQVDYFEGPEAVIAHPALEISLALNAVYEGALQAEA